MIKKIYLIYLLPPSFHPPPSPLSLLNFSWTAAISCSYKLPERFLSACPLIPSELDTHAVEEASSRGWVLNIVNRNILFISCLPPSTPPPLPLSLLNFSRTKCERNGKRNEQARWGNLHKLARVPCCMTWRSKIWILFCLRLPTLLNNRLYSITKATALIANIKSIQTVRACLIISPRLTIVDFRNLTGFVSIIILSIKTIKYDFHPQLKRVNWSIVLVFFFCIFFNLKFTYRFLVLQIVSGFKSLNDSTVNQIPG